MGVCCNTDPKQIEEQSEIKKFIGQNKTAQQLFLYNSQINISQNKQAKRSYIKGFLISGGQASQWNDSKSSLLYSRKFREEISDNKAIIKLEAHCDEKGQVIHIENKIEVILEGKTLDLSKPDLQIKFEQIKQINKMPQVASQLNYRAFIKPPSSIQKKQSQQITKQLQISVTKSQEKSNNILLLVLKQQMQNLGAQVTISKNSSIQSKMGMFKLTSGQFEQQMQYKQERLKIQFSQVSKTPKTYQNFINQFKRKKAQEFKIDQDQIVIHSVKSGSVIVEFSHPSTGLPRQYFKQFRLALNDFQQKYNTDFQNFKPDNIEFRGRWPYWQPYKCQRFAIKVLNQYPDGNKWLQMKNQPGQWAVGFHGVKKPAEQVKDHADKKVLQCIFQGRKQGKMLKQGPGQACNNFICEKTNLQIGKGIYLSPHFQICLQNYAQPLNVLIGGDNHKFHLILQCRIRPQSIRVYKEFFVINKSEDVRPYGVILISQSQKKQINQRPAKPFKMSDYIKDIP